jgi:hypothetical protein
MSIFYHVGFGDMLYVALFVVPIALWSHLRSSLAAQVPCILGVNLTAADLEEYLQQVRTLI